MYQEIFHKFGDFDRIRLSTPLSIYTLVLIALDSPLAGWVESNGDKETIAKVIKYLFRKKKELEYILFAMFKYKLFHDKNNLSLIKQKYFRIRYIFQLFIFLNTETHK